jgi:hypothetical protein
MFLRQMAISPVIIEKLEFLSYESDNRQIRPEQFSFNSGKE